MKNNIKYLMAICLTLIATMNYAQIAINNDNSNPDASSILDIKSSDKGMLIPRMSAIQRDNITTPATGLMVYVNDDNSFYYYNGSAWQKMGTSNNIVEIKDAVSAASC